MPQREVGESQSSEVTKLDEREVKAAEAKLTSLTRKRGSLKASVTVFKNYVESVQAEHTLSDIEYVKLQERLTKTQQIMGDFESTQLEIEAIANDLDAQMLQRAKFEDDFFSSVALAKILLTTHARQIMPTDAGSSSSSSPSENVPIANLNSVKLPLIELPKFDGNYDAWLEFRDTFDSMIGNNARLPDIQKFHYLRASLVGNAAQVIKSVEFTAAGYQVAWDALCERYNNVKLLVHNHVKSLFSLDTIQKESSSKIRKLIDSVSKHLRSLEQLGEQVQNWDTLLIYIITTKLDEQTLREWERYTADAREAPKLEDIKNFLKNRADFLETVDSKTSEKQFKRRDYKQVTKGLVASSYSCNYCKQNHNIYTCEEFLKLPVSDRHAHVKSANLCVNCLRTGHAGKRCKVGPCKKCKAWHNTLLHTDNVASDKKPEQTNTLNSSIICHSGGYIFLSTAYVNLLDSDNQAHRVRALLDCGSQTSFLTERMLKRLRLSVKETTLAIHGISNSLSKANYKSEVKLHSMQTSFQANLTCYILPEITSVTPSYKIDISQLSIPNNINLADPEFFKPGSIDLLIGADLFWTLLCPGKISFGKDKPTFQKTKLGWVVSGLIGAAPDSKVSCNVSSSRVELHKLVSRFWEIEEIDSPRLLAPEEKECERIFKETTRRDADGRFIVTLPLKQSADNLGESKAQAEQRFYSCERKFLKNESLRERYSTFMKEYVELNHMSEVHENLKQNGPEYYMPHHGVLRESSLTTKLRVVFDASAPSSSGLSLNNLQMVGPVLQDDLLSILLRFREHEYVVSADIAKMYRQVLVEPSQRQLQKIIWRQEPDEPLKVFALNTVTYGQASASYLSIRCLFELANEFEGSHPDIAEIIRHDFYVDDLLTGANTIERTAHICREIYRILKTGCFELRKWYSNNPEVLRDMQELGLECGVIEFSPGEHAKILGLIWACQTDQLSYAIQPILQKTISKRTILAAIASVFDPLGLISPCTIIAKLIIQELWTLKISWDQTVPSQLAFKWSKFKAELTELNDLHIQRQVVNTSDRHPQLHGFADASERAYGACVFIRSIGNKGERSVRLLCAKSKVAPIKSQSTPRLELCAAQLLSQLVDKVVKSMNISFSRCVLWSDSTVVLCWIGTSPNLLKTFVSNRVSEIQTLTEGYEWRYVPTQDNPADLVSRGLYPSQILGSRLWWNGPEWLQLDYSDWPSALHPAETPPELKTQSSSLPAFTPLRFPFENCSNFIRLKRVVAYVLRWKGICSTDTPERNRGPLSNTELNKALICLTKLSQSESFPEELAKLSRGKCLEPKCKMFNLTPFLDDNGIIRVGGRLKNSEFSHEKRHPAVLDAHHHFTKILFAYEHVRLLHAGPQLLLSSIRDKFWPIGGRNLARTIVHKCIKCFRFNARNVQPIMGNLPHDRVTPTSPFSISGVDYAGPFLIRDRKGRGGKTTKCYVCIFICFATKAMHLELVSSLSSDAFLSTLRRFISRRGRPIRVYSDNGTNFVGAKRELSKFLSVNKETVIENLASEGIDWHFIPPHSPHFGGLWEAGVKSFKHHLKRVLADNKLTFEEFTTVLTQTEAILNSRPLTPLSSDPNDLAPLSPAHFLVGRSLVAAPDEVLLNINDNRLTRYQYLQKLIQHLWQRWTKEYISELQQRTKWKSQQGQLSEGALVIVKEDQSLPTHWKLGRILELHKGLDGIARVASIKTSNGIMKRGFQKICPLPLSD